MQLFVVWFGMNNKPQFFCIIIIIIIIPTSQTMQKYVHTDTYSGCSSRWIWRGRQHIIGDSATG